MFLIIFIVAGVILGVGSKIPHITKDSGSKLQLEGCKVGDIIENECNKCTCTQRHVYECKSKACDKTTEGSRETLRSSSCQPHRIYNQLATICICKPDGRWPHQSCIDVFQSLPASKVVQQQCTPKNYIHVDCNICWCDEDGQIDDHRCTKNECDTEIQGDRRRNTYTSNVFGDCTSKQWYSLAPCQFCYCLSNNKLMCNTGHHSHQTLQLGQSNFTQCGSELLREILDLVPEGKSAANALAMRSAAKPSTLPNIRSHDWQIPNLDLDEDRSIPEGKHEEHETNEKSDKESNEVETKKGGDRSTKLPYYDGTYYGSGKDVRNGKEVVSSSESAEEVVVERPTHRTTSTTTTTTTERPGVAGSFFSALIPNVIGQMFNMRKTVVLDSKTKCEPETQFTVKCNHCYCMKNGKLMCTNNTCT